MSEVVLLMAYGTPERLEDVPAYYTHIRGGSAPPPVLVADLIDRYRAVGGPTALNRITRAQARSLERALAERGLRVPVHVGFKHVAPFIGEAVGRIAAGGVGRAVGLVLAPHYSLRSIAEYITYAEAGRSPDLDLDIIRSWHDDPGLIAFLADRLGEALRTAGSDPHVVFTAHSVPASVLAGGDPYPDELARTSERVAERVGIRRWTFAYQSAGRTREAWLGPDIREVIDALAREGEKGIVVQPIGFVADHLEVLYDLDIEARAAAERCDLSFARTRMPNADPAFIAVLAEIVASRLAADRPPADRT
ncbi:MAG TPA: ferrochelatase [Gemmatimonadota bacterium]|nr:ferrochelatase [Gemmatimonadota bacterium]